MNVLVDTSVWSLALRRSKPQGPGVELLRDLIEDGRAVMIGAIRQELLSGIGSRKQFEVLRDTLRSFVDLPLERSVIEGAAEFFNTCRATGVQGSNADFLICSAASHHQVPILTTDRDFERYAEFLPIRLLAVNSGF